MTNVWIRVAYGVLLAVVTSLTVGFGVLMVYPGPKPPDTPKLTFRQLQSGGDNQQDADLIIQTVDRFYQDAYEYRWAYPSFQRNVLVAFVLLAIILGAIGTGIPAVFNVLRFGLILAAVLLLAYAVRFSLASAPNPAPANSASITNLLAAGSPPGLDFPGRFLRFAASFIALLICLFMGLWRLTEWSSSTEPAPAHSSSTESSSEAARSEPPVAVEASPEQLQWKRPDPQ